jgi:hypothetical protein
LQPSYPPSPIDDISFSPTRFREALEASVAPNVTILLIH